jgi:signal transduction histidine kinase
MASLHSRPGESQKIPPVDASELEALKEQVIMLEGMVSTMMKANSDSGQILRFFMSSFKVESFTDLANLLLEHLAFLGIDACININTLNSSEFYSLNVENGEEEREYLELRRTEGRLFEDKNRLVVNYGNSALLIKNLPENAVERGELRDDLAILMDGIEAKIQTLLYRQREAEAQKVKSEFFNLMSHELKTPLNPIIGFSNRLSKKLKNLSPSDDRAFQAINQNVL